jgi:hypothetical protein
VLYRLPQVIAAVQAGETIYIVEGEKDVHAIEAVGGTATCNPMGAGKWSDEFNAVLMGASVVIVADRDEDEQGLEHAITVESSLMGIAARISIVQSVSGSKDAHDHLTAGYELGDFISVVGQSSHADQVDAKNRRNGGKKKSETPLAKVGKLLGYSGDDRFTRAWRPTDSGDAPLTVETASGLSVRWERQRDMLKPGDLAFPALAGGKGPKKPLTMEQAQGVYKALVLACETLEKVEPLDEAREWVEGFLGIANVLSVTPALDAVAEFALLQDFRDAEPLTKSRHPDTWTPPILVDSSHRYIRRADLAAYVREVRHETIGYRALTGRVGEIGWEHHDRQMWEPDVPRRGADHVRVRTYRQPLEDE